MNFDDLDSSMRIFETAHDHCALPGMHLIARLDGRGFTRLTKDVCRFEAPFDKRFCDMMVATAESLMTCGFRVRYAYTESDEISLLLEQQEQLFGRKLRKYNSTLAGEASAKFSLLLGRVATFDCRVSQLLSVELVVDYFRWRSADAARNALNAYCYWTLRKDRLDKRAATKRLMGLSVSQKHELLHDYGINFNDLPAWQKRGVGLCWKEFDREGKNPLTGETTVARRRRISRDFDLPMKEAYSEFVRGIVSSAP